MWLGNKISGAEQGSGGVNSRQDYGVGDIAVGEIRG